MSIASPERWQRIELLFAGALDRPAPERAAYLESVCTDDPALGAELDRLLDAHDRAGRFLDELDPERSAALLEAVGEEGEPGQTIGRYRVVRRLGRGGMGVVYLAHDARLDRPVALKLLPPYLSADEQAKRRLTEEAKAASALDHSNIATIYEIDETEDGRLFLAMAYYEGETLRERIARGPLPIDEAVGVGLQVASALAAAHGRGIVHRDVKPANVILTGEGVAKVVDFGVAKVTGSTLTQPGQTPGTVAYMSPEQTRGEAVDPRTDLWSFGVVLYEMLTGRRPFRGEHGQALIYAIRHDAPPPLEISRSDVPPKLATIVARCVEKEPGRRFQSADELVSALSDAQDSSMAVAHGRAAALPPPTGARSRAATTRDGRSPRPVLARLNERKLLEWALASLGAAWFLLQLSDLIGERFGWPDPLMLSLTVLLALGLPAAVALAWFRGARGGQRVKGRGLLLFAAGTAVAGLLLFGVNSGRTSEQRGVVAAADAEISAAAPLRLAVLPVANYSPDPEDEYFADGMTEELISRLARLRDLRVIARTSVLSYKGTEKSIAEIADELRVATILESSVRKAGDQVRITVQLVDAQTQESLWSEDYDAELADVLAVQSEIAAQVAEALNVRLQRDERRQLARMGTEDPEAYKLYLQGRYFWNKRDTENFQKALAYFRQAIDRDPLYAPAWAGLADTYEMLAGVQLPPEQAVALARAAAERALALDNDLAEAHTALATNLMSYELNWEGAGQHFQRAIALNPSYALAHMRRASFLAALGQLEAGVKSARRAQDLDPLSVYARAGVGFHLYLAGRYEEALAQLQATRELDPRFGLTYVNLVLLNLKLRRYDEALSAARTVQSLWGDDPTVLGLLAHAYAVSGQEEEARRILRQLATELEHRPGASFHLAVAHLGLGERTRAIELLERAVAEKSTGLIVYLGTDALFDPLRTEPRFQTLLEKMGLTGRR